MPVRIFPATDLHFLIGTSVTVRVFDTVNDVWTDVSGAPQFNMNLAPLPAFVNQAGTTITATALGSAATRLVAAAPILPNAFASPIRLSVHQQLHALFLAQPAVTLQTSRNDRVITVYGEFQEAGGTLVTEDITAHPFLRYNVRVTSGTPTVTVDALGRITTNDVPGTVEIDITVDPALNQPAPLITLRVTIIAAITDRPILQRLHEGTSVRKKSILFLPEGFTTKDQREFETLARDAGRALLNNISPYRHLRESFDLYSAFLPSAEDGVTMGPPLVVFPAAAVNRGAPLPMNVPLAQGVPSLQQLLLALGHPLNSQITTAVQARMQLNLSTTQLPDVLFNMWSALRTQPPYGRLRETFFGLLLGPRHNGTTAASQPVSGVIPTQPDAATFIHLQPEDLRSVNFDDRRLPDLTTVAPDKAHLPSFSRFVTSLRTPSGPQGFGAIWAEHGESFGLVVIIARADHFGGTRREGALLITNGAAMICQVAASTLVPRLSEIVPLARPISAANRQLGFLELSVNAGAETMAHELAHSTALGTLNDEYGGRNAPPDLTNATAVTFVEEAPNTQLLENVRPAPGPGLNVSMIKWNFERVEAAAYVEKILVSGNELEITVNSENTGPWLSVAADRLLTLRVASLQGPARGSTHVGNTTANPTPQSLKFVKFDMANQVIHCTVLGTATPAQVATTFPVGSVIQIPKLFAGATVRLIPVEINQELTQHGQFFKSTEHASQQPITCDEAVSPQLPLISGFRWPAHQTQAIGAYEAGASHNCRTIRPTGECKMRTVDPPTNFCYVCKYIIVNAVNPGLLSAIEAEYP
jgi:hypothetical protein